MYVYSWSLRDRIVLNEHLVKNVDRSLLSTGATNVPYFTICKRGCRAECQKHTMFVFCVCIDTLPSSPSCTVLNWDGLASEAAVQMYALYLRSSARMPYIHPVRSGILQRLCHILGNHNDTQPCKQIQLHHTRRLVHYLCT
jgi:hypothetical protein